MDRFVTIKEALDEGFYWATSEDGKKHNDLKEMRQDDIDEYPYVVQGGKFYGSDLKLKHE